MSELSVLDLQQSSAANMVAAIGWLLEPGRAVTVHARQAGELTIAQGRVWATLDGPHSGASLAAGDLVLAAGDRLSLRAGQRAVLEPWSRSAGTSACVKWLQSGRA